MAKNNFLLEIVSPEGIVYEESVEEVTLPTESGEIAILPHHAPIFTKLSEGEVVIKKDGKTTTIVIAGGFLELQNNNAHVLSDYAIRAESIQTAKAEEKKRLAESKLREKVEKAEFTTADKDLKRAILELKVAEKMRKRQRVQ
ncbi:MAG: ATP synthase F1 subunit epsilon [Candidatus Levybacteria bacterium CG10_big_fil_rev_8_21_14_0_10_36_7]|nr:MAG: ATP synthase F1 subunit epsilon [Candidatus Levybacteria bacterium CG10_big_fil_rev_8_21_14_0_10_36_7]